MKKKIRFIANPFSGPKTGVNIEELITNNIDHDVFDYEIKYTQYPKHASILADEAAKADYYAVIAVGGDGTINEVASSLVYSKTALGIIPLGSGNGFSYHIGLRRNIKKAIKTLNECYTMAVDTGEANGRFFINVAGLGLDATVAYKTKLNTKRGFFPYFINTLKESLRFKFLRLQITTSNKVWEGEYAMAVIANGSVYGYDFTIAPEASITDGVFDVILIKKTQIFRYFLMVPRMLNKTIHKSPLVEYFRAPQIKIENKDKGYFHVDGEGLQSDESIEFQIRPASILVLSNMN